MERYIVYKTKPKSYRFSTLIIHSLGEMEKASHSQHQWGKKRKEKKKKKRGEGIRKRRRRASRRKRKA